MLWSRSASLIAGAPELDAGDLREPLDEEGDLRAEEALDLLAGREGVLERVVEQAGDDRVFVDEEVEQDAGDLERMDQVRLAGEPLLAVVDLRGEDVGALEPLQVDLGVVVQEAVGDVVEAERRGHENACGSGEL
jgi:hypothetical protein